MTKLGLYIKPSSPLNTHLYNMLCFNPEKYRQEDSFPALILDYPKDCNQILDLTSTPEVYSTVQYLT